MDEKIIEKERPKWPLQRLNGMYFAMHCWKCKKFELPMEKYKKICEENIQKIIDNLEIKEMKFKEFNEIIKNSTFCKLQKSKISDSDQNHKIWTFEKRNFSNNCPICKKLGISVRI
ncbi:hypothetical protein HZA33_02045 [Candidatus Pacearchaeota archaeon]|nr:hypothetical protein [Candidatus Pacearchaeota archaeon]